MLSPAAWRFGGGGGAAAVVGEGLMSDSLLTATVLERHAGEVVFKMPSFFFQC